MENINTLTEILTELQTITQEITNSAPLENFFTGLDEVLSIFNGLNEATEHFQKNIKPFIDGISNISSALKDNTIATWAQEAAMKVLNSSLVQNTLELFETRGRFSCLLKSL